MITQTITPDPLSSVEISTSAKGVPQIQIKIYREDPEDAAQQALALYRRLTAALASGQPLLPETAPPPGPAWSGPAHDADEPF